MQAQPTDAPGEFKEFKLKIRACDGASELVGILRSRFEDERQLEEGIRERRRGGRPSDLFLFCHGMFGHKNNFFFPALAAGLPFATFRFDFRGAGESTGEWTFDGYDRDLEDIATIQSYLEARGFRVKGLLGHSRGANIVLFQAMRARPSLRYIINMSGRFYFNSGFAGKFPETVDLIEREGSFSLSATVRGQHREWLVSKDQAYTWMAYDSRMKRLYAIPKSTSILTLHGIRDEVVPVLDASCIASAVPTHTLQLVENDHNYIEEDRAEKGAILVNRISDWWAQEERDVGRYYTMFAPNFNVNVEGVVGFHALAGLPCLDDTYTSNSLYRSGSIKNITEQGVHMLKGLGIGLMFDLRITVGEPRSIPGITLLPKHCAMLPSVVQEDLVFAWFEQSKEGIVDAMRHLVRSSSLSPTPSSVLFTCSTAGGTLSGLFVAVLMWMRGLDDDLIIREFEISSHLTKGLETSDQIKSSASFAIRCVLQHLWRVYGSAEMLLASCPKKDDSPGDELIAFRKRWSSRFPSFQSFL